MGAHLPFVAFSASRGRLTEALMMKSIVSVTSVSLSPETVSLAVSRIFSILKRVLLTNLLCKYILGLTDGENENNMCRLRLLLVDCCCLFEGA